MSTSGQGDQKVEISKDESEITSTSDNDGAPVSVAEIKTIEAVATDADSTVPLPQSAVESKETSSKAVNDEVETDSAIDSIATESNNDKGNKSGMEEFACGTTLPGKDMVSSPKECSNIEPCSSKTSDKDSGSFTEEMELKWDEDDVDEAILADDKKDQDIENSGSKSTLDETAQLIQKLELVINETKTGVDEELIENESNQSCNQMNEDKSSDVVNIQRDETLSSKDDLDRDKITSRIDEGNKIDVEMTSMSFKSQNIIDKIDNLTKEAVINKDVGDLSLDEPKPVDNITPNLEMDIDTILTNEFSKNVEPQLHKEVEMDVEISESLLKSIEKSGSSQKDSDDKCEAANNESSVLKEIDTKEVPLLDTIDKDTKEIIDTDSKDVEIKDLEPKESTNQNEDKKEINDPINISTEVSSNIDSKTQNNQGDTENINKQLEAINTTKNNSEKNESIPIEESDCTKSDSVKDSKTDDSLLDTIIPNIHHRINKPNVMLDIPTQELSDIEAELDDDVLNYDADVKTLDKTEPETDTDVMREMSEIVAENVIDKVSVTNLIEIDATSSVLNINTVSRNSEELQSIQEPTSNLEPQRVATSKEVIDGSITSTQEIDENVVTEISNLNSTVTELNAEVKKMQIDGPSTSKSEDNLEMPPDADHDQAVSDSLGLLAESSRVMDDNDDDDGDDAEDQEVDDIDDEDFDPYEETNSEMAEDMDDSNTPPSELDLKLIKPEDKLERESDEDAQESTMDIVDDIECDENDLDLELPDDTVSEDVSINESKPEILNTDLNKEDKSCRPDKIINILEKVLGTQMSTGCKAKDTSVKGHVRTYVEVEGSSDSDDVQEVSKTLGLESASTEVTGSGSTLATPKTQTKIPKINTDDVTIKTSSASSTTALHIPEIDPKPSTKRDEIYNLDSDDDEMAKKDDKENTSPKKTVTEDVKAPKEETPKTEKKCINPSCTSETRTYYVADRSTAAYYSLTRRSALVCEPCRRRACERSEALINGIKDLRPLLELDMDAPSQQLVEISDSDSDGEGGDETDCIGEKGAGFLEEHLANVINETWIKYAMESRLKTTETHLLKELEKMEADAKEIDAMLDECQKKTDAIRFDFYKDYETRRKNVGAIILHDTPFSSYSHVEKDIDQKPKETFGSRYPKRRATSLTNDTPAKKPAIPLGYSSLDGDKMTDPVEWKGDDDKEDISVVKLSAESAPADLPPPGEIVRPPLKAGMTIYAMRNAFGTWLKGKIVDVQPKTAGQQFSQCRVKFEHKVKNPCKVLAGRCLAYSEPSGVRMTIGTRVVALFKDPQNPTRRESFYGGVIAEIPNPVNSYRYLVFFDDGYAQYVLHRDTRVVCESSALVWEEVHQFIRDFVCKYLLSYPERPMVRLHAGEKLKTEWNGKWWDSKVLKVDASIALINFDEDNRTEWIYRGSTRLAPLYLELQAARVGEGKGRSRLPRNKALIRTNMPCVEYTRSDEQATTRASETQQNEEMRRQRAVAKKSTTQSIPPTLAPGSTYEGVISRVVYYTPKNAVKPYKMAPHTCSVKCRRSDLLSLKDLRTYNPLAKPLLSGWERQTVRYKCHRSVLYRAPCGRRVRSLPELHGYLRAVHSELAVDLFDFTPGTHCLAEFVLSKCNVSKKDLSHGKENVPVPCVNYYDNSLPEFCSYNTERTPTAGVPLNLDPEFLCGCDCTDDCVDKTKCACWKMTLEGARTIGLEGPNIGYAYRRLPEPLPSGIYECNSRCKCKQTCLNRVAQHPLQLKLQVFKTVNRGWGIRALNDVPKGSFLCVYAGNLLTDATANLDGLNEGDEYLAELDYIEVVEAMKEGYEDDVPEEDKKLDKKATSASESEPSSESEEEQDHTKEDGDFEPGYITHTNLEFKKSLRKREKAKKKEEEKQKEEATKERKDDCITISDDEEVREPSRFTAEAGMADKGLITKQSSRVSVRTLFGKDEACYIMDAKVQGNIGRYLNHSCHPNVFVQNVFVDTHDPRFPWVAFFALSHVRAGTELTWNYNYDVGSVPEKVLYCYCGAANCRGRLL